MRIKSYPFKFDTVPMHGRERTCRDPAAIGSQGDATGFSDRLGPLTLILTKSPPLIQKQVLYSSSLQIEDCSLNSSALVQGYGLRNGHDDMRGPVIARVYGRRE